MAFPVSINNIGHYYNPSYVAEYMYDATGTYGMNIRCSYCCLVFNFIDLAVPTIGKPDISFHGDVLDHGTSVQFQAGTVKFSAEIPSTSSLHLEASLDWFVVF